MILTSENILLIGSLLLLISLIVGKASFRFGVPTLLLFLAVGMLAGTDGIGGIEFENPKIAQFIGVIALNVILFSGGLDTHWKSVKPIWKQSAVLSTFGVLVTALVLGTFVYYITDFTIYESLLLGSIVSSTDAAAVFSILRSRSIALKDNIRPTLEFESGSNDPMAYVLTILFLGLVVNQDQSIYSTIPIFFQQMFLGGILGFGFGYASKYLINRINLGYDTLYPILVIALMFITFSFTELIGGNGFLSIYICGVFLSNQEFIQKKSIIRIFEGMAWLMQIVLFLTLGLLVNPTAIIPYIGLGMLISLFLILVARPISVFSSLSFFKMSNRRRFFISWVGLRGAVPIVFATYPLMAGVEKADVIFNIVFFISLTSVLIQGTTISAFAKLFKVALPEDEKKVTEMDRIILDLPKSKFKKFQIPKHSVIVGEQIIDLDLPSSVSIVIIRRGNEYIQAHGRTIIHAEDILTILGDSEDDFKAISAYMNELGQAAINT